MTDELPIAGGDATLATASSSASATRFDGTSGGTRRPSRLQWMAGAPQGGEVVCHNDLFWPNVVVRDGRVVGLIDWDLASPATRLHDLASAANF